LANQYNIYPIGWLEKLEVNIQGVKTKADFKVIKVMDEFDPYPILLGIGWAFDNNIVLTLKKRYMSFETNTLCVVTSLFPYDDDWYNDPMDKDAQISGIENIYKIMGCREGYIIPTIDGDLRWRSFKSYDIDSEDSMEKWKKKIYKVSTCRCTRITKAVQWIESKLSDASRFDGTGPMETFLIQMDKIILMD
jgi:hypothetical protein